MRILSPDLVGVSGHDVELDLESVQRILVNDDVPGGTGWSVGASFAAATESQNITFSATAIGGSILDALETTAGTEHPIAGGWTFSTSNYDVTPTNPVYLSLEVGSVSDPDLLQLWHYDGCNWAAFSAPDLTYDGVYASFTATDFSGYAVTVPEPNTLFLLAIAIIGLSVARRRPLAR